MYEVDARGLSCPEPIMLTQAAIKNNSGAIKVLVSEPHQKTNVEKFAKSQGKKVTVTEKGDEFELVIEQKRENMRQKEWKLVITFHTTADAIAFEKACKSNGKPGRMIPVPREISAGCGLAWVQYSCLENPMDRGAWQATVYGVARVGHD